MKFAMFILTLALSLLCIQCTVKVQTVTATLSRQVTNYIKSSTILNLTFSDSLPTTTTTILSDAIDIKFKSLTYGTDFTWAVTSKVSNTVFQITITYYTNIYVKTLYLYFINPYAIVTASTTYLSLDSYSISVDVGPVVTFESALETEYQTMSTILIISMIAFASLYLIVYTLRLLKEGLTLFWAWVDLIQLYNLFLFIDTNHFENVASLLRSCEYMNFWSSNFIDQYRDSAMFSIFQEGSEVSATANPPYRFITEEYQTYFLQNAFFPLLIVVIGIILLLASLIICPSSRFGFQNVLRNLIQFSLPIRGTLISCCQITLSALLFFKNFTGTFNMISCIVILAYYVLCIVWFISILNTGLPTPLKEQISKDKYGSLYEGLILKAIFKRNFNVFFMFRKMVVAIFVVFLDNTDMFQMIFLLIVQIVFMGLIASKLPYIFSKSNLFMVISEFFLSFFLLLMSAWIIFDYLGEDFISFDNRMSISWVLHVIILLSIFTRVVGIFFEAEHIYLQEKQAAKLEEKQLQTEQQMEEFKGGVHQKLLVYHHQIKDNLTLNQNDEAENPDDFQFIDMPDIYELIRKEQEEESNELKEQQKQQQQQQNMEEGQQENGEKEDGNQQQSDDEDPLDTSFKNSTHVK